MNEERLSQIRDGISATQRLCHLAQGCVTGGKLSNSYLRPPRSRYASILLLSMNSIRKSTQLLRAGYCPEETQTTRKPQVLGIGVALSRWADLEVKALPPQLPPRATWNEPVAAPIGSVTEVSG